MLSQVLNDAEAVDLRAHEFKQIAQSHCLLSIYSGLSQKIRAKTIRLDLIENKLVKLGGSELLDRLSERHLVLQIITQTKLPGHLLQLCKARFLNLDLDFVADSKLVLDVLGAAHAAEDSTADHNAQLGR
mmetsp:Transcript_18707/g.25268  ORF Transcript_18707/g.25268 Transcript_18707/m.25268 type:complete len:130 (+) Transcript_18707:552-941(+)